MKLLISVINGVEAEAAVKGGADIIDIKNPAEGALGINFPAVITEQTERLDCPVSAAGGDLKNTPGMAAMIARGLASCGVDFIKIGMKWLPRDNEEAVKYFYRVKEAVREIAPGCRVMIVGYADFRRNGLCSPLSLPDIANKAGVDGVMIDTLVKDGRGLFDLLSESEVEIFLKKAGTSQLLTALAGSLRIDDLNRLARFNPDIIGFRSAACRNFNREAAVDIRLVSKLAERIKELLHHEAANI